jgi:hypothetical protein
MTTQKRAKVGGETGTNGEFYEGGKFLPSTEKAKGKPKATKVRKVEIEPFVWVERPEGKTAIYPQLAGIYGRVINGEMVLNFSTETLRYYGRTAEEVIELGRRYNAGERFI